jgi:N,N'-diacetyllegionaminate synthase
MRLTWSAERPLLIAEIGVNHDGSVERAAVMMEQAAAAGFDAVKFQYWITEELLAEHVPTAPYQGSGDQHALLEGLRLDRTQLTALRETARHLGVGFVVTPDGEHACTDVLAMEPDALKVGSADADNPWLIAKVSESGLPVIASTGMMSDDEVVRLGERLADVREVVILHCVSAYPTPLPHVNLGRMHRLRGLTRREVGFSDHTVGIGAAAAAIGMGAVVVEKHVTWSLDASGPDHSSSLLLDDAEIWVRTLVDVAQGRHTAIVSPDEAANRRVVRKALYAAHDLQVGSALRREDLVPLRPLLDGIPADQLDSVMGRILRRKVSAGSLIQPEDIRA